MNKSPGIVHALPTRPTDRSLDKNRTYPGTIRSISIEECDNSWTILIDLFYLMVRFIAFMLIASF